MLNENCCLALGQLGYGNMRSNLHIIEKEAFVFC